MKEPRQSNSKITVSMRSSYLKSLYPVPMEDRGLLGVHRVLKPGGLAYISEPVYAGGFNDIMRIFHNEKSVREAAFEGDRSFYFIF